MSVNDRASLETTMRALPKLFLRRFQAGLRATRHQNPRAPIEEHLRRREPHAARAADNHRLFILYRSMRTLLATPGVPSYFRTI